MVSKIEVRWLFLALLSRKWNYWVGSDSPGYTGVIWIPRVGKFTGIIRSCSIGPPATL